MGDAKIDIKSVTYDEGLKLVGVQPRGTFYPGHYWDFLVVCENKKARELYLVFTIVFFTQHSFITIHTHTVMTPTTSLLLGKSLNSFSTLFN